VFAGPVRAGERHQTKPARAMKPKPFSTLNLFTVP
jgi:hypothetical protein